MKPIFILIGMLLLFTSCEKDGPQGPQGPSGPQGLTGPTGSVNIQEFNYVITAANWIPTSGTTPVWETSIQVPALTQAVLSNSIVLVYYNQGNSTTLLPFTIAGLDYVYYSTVGAIQVQVTRNGQYLLASPSAVIPVVIKVIIAQ